VLGVRAARSEDAASVARVHVRSWQVAYRGLLPDEYLDGLRPEHRMSQYTFDSSDPECPLTVVAAEEDVICGFATTGPCRDDDDLGAGELLALYVDPESWGMGVGRRLIGEARLQLRRQGFTMAVVWVLNGNVRARRFYDLDGWVSDEGVRQEVVWGVPVEESRFRRFLSP
jgi:GNAT superfamily N-acetyltransferase